MSDDLQFQIDLLRDEIAGSERQIAALRGEINEMERDMDEFQKRYDKIIAPMQARLEVIRAAIQELRDQRRTAQGKVYQPDYSKLGEGYVPVEEQYRRAWARPPEPPTDPFADTKPNAATDPEPLDKDDLLKRLYRQLARRFHPDLAPDDKERTRRTAIMSQINAAYTAKDVNALRAIAQDPSGSADRPLHALTLESLRRQLKALDGQVSLLKQQRDELLYGAMMKLKLDDKLAHLKGRDLLMEMRVEMEREYDALLAQLDQLRRE